MSTQTSVVIKYLSRCGGIGRHKGLKIPRSNIRTGSSPVSGTIKASSHLRACFFVPSFYFLFFSLSSAIRIDDNNIIHDPAERLREKA